MRLVRAAPAAQSDPAGPAAAGNPARIYYGWVIVGVLALTVTVSYGVLMYAFPVVLVPMQADLGWSLPVLTGGFSAAALMCGIAAMPVGRWVDRFGPRVVMTAGSGFATILLLAWAYVDDLLSYYLVWAGLGACMAAVFYEPGFAVVQHWFRARRAHALTIITLAGGLASTIFVPATSWLVIAYGWRAAVTWLAVALGVLTILPHALLLRNRPADLGLLPDGGSRTRAAAHPDAHTGTCDGAASGQECSLTARAAFRSRSFRWLGIAFFLATAANFAIVVHIVPLLLGRGFPVAAAGAALALLGLAKLPGRLLMGPLMQRWSTPSAMVLVFALQIAGLVALAVSPDAAGVWTFIALFGAGDGASTLARGAVVGEFYGPAACGEIGGALSFIVALGRAAAPLGASVAHVVFGGYDALPWILAGMVAAAALAMARTQRRSGGIRESGISRTGRRPASTQGAARPCC